MLIRSTPDACFVMLRNGLTLELFYDAALTGAPRRPHRPRGSHASAPSASQGVWMMGEFVLVEVRAGQA